MNGPEDDDDFERLLTAALDPGGIDLTAAEREEILASARFVEALADALDPGEIAFEAARRRDLVVRLTIAVKDEELTAWALGELAGMGREVLERRMAGDGELKREGLEIRNFCCRAESLLPPRPVPGWCERRRLRRVFSDRRAGDRGLWLAGAAVWALAWLLFQKPESPGAPGLARSTMAVTSEVKTGPVPLSATARAENGAGPEVADPLHEWPVPRPASRTLNRPSATAPWFPTVAPGRPREPEFSCAPPPSRPAMEPVAGPPVDLDQLLAIDLRPPGEGPRWQRLPSVREFESGAPLLANLDGAAPIPSPRLPWGSRGLEAAAIGRTDGADPDSDSAAGLEKPLPAAVPEAGSFVLSQAQPYLFSALLRGPVSGRPDLTRSGAATWMSADFQTMDLNLPSGNGGVESDTSRIEAGMSWLLSPSWQAGVSLTGIDSRMDVPGFGTVDAEGVAFSWSLDWRHGGYHAALTHRLGTFDQDLWRMSGGMMRPAAQDATVQLLSLWFTREFDAGNWVHGPVAGLEGSWGSFDGYQEPFAGGVAMAGRDFALMTFLIGWQASGRYDTPAGTWLPHAVIGWRHRATLADAAMVQGGQTGNFGVPPVLPERDSVLLEGGLRWLPPGSPMFFDAITSVEWREGGKSDNSVLLKLGVKF